MQLKTHLSSRVSRVASLAAAQCDIELSSRWNND